MKTFNYHSAKDVKEASKLSSSSSAYLAGGMTTIPSMKLGLASYKDIINIKEIKKLSGIKVSGKKSGVILEPYLGTGTTCIVAEEMGFESIGIDIDSSYVEFAGNKLKEKLDNDHQKSVY